MSSFPDPRAAAKKKNASVAFGALIRCFAFFAFCLLLFPAPAPGSLKLPSSASPPFPFPAPVSAPAISAFASASRPHLPIVADVIIIIMGRPKNSNAGGSSGGSSGGLSGGSSSGSSGGTSGGSSSGPSGSSSPASLSVLERRVADLEERQKKQSLFAIVRQKKDLLNSEVKAYSNNFVIKGIKFSIKDVQGDDDKEEQFRVKMVRVFVDQGLVSFDRVFGPKVNGRDRILTGVLRHCHPLGSRDNCSVVVAFLESWLAGHINKRLAAGKKLKDGVRITPHLPPIIDALRNAALKYRRDELSVNPNRKLVMKTLLRQPWIQLVEVKNGKKVPIDFDVDDRRLLNPAVTLAKLEVLGKAFKPKAFLSDEERRHNQGGTVKAKPHDGDDDAEIDDLDLSLMDYM